MTMVLGPTSLSLAAPFSSDLITYANFTVTRMPNSGVEDVGKVAKIKPSKEFVWREKMAFSYRVRREKLKGKHTSLVRARASAPAAPESLARMLSTPLARCATHLRRGAILCGFGTLRLRTCAGWHAKTERAPFSRHPCSQDILDMRCKKKADRMCM